jgi:hypothetical protein
MPTPITIEELLKMKPCPFEEGVYINSKKAEEYEANPLCDLLILKRAQNAVFYDAPFKMPEGYFHLPTDKQLGLPLGEWTFKQLYQLVKILPFGAVKAYCFNDDIAIDKNGYGLQPSDFDGREKSLEIKKQPPNLYNPIDQQAEEVPAETAKETATMTLPWQDIRTLEGSDWGGYVTFQLNTGEISTCLRRYINAPQFISHWFPTPASPTFTAPVEPERVSHPDFVFAPHGKWYYHGDGYKEFNFVGTYNNYHCRIVVGVIKNDKPIYATDPTAWLAWKAKQEGNQ